MRPYGVVLTRPAAEFYRRTRGSVFRELDHELDLLATAPHRPADLEDHGEDSRLVVIGFLLRTSLTVELDEAVREVRVILIEPLGR